MKINFQVSAEKRIMTNRKSISQISLPLQDDFEGKILKKTLVGQIIKNMNSNRGKRVGCPLQSFDNVTHIEITCTSKNSFYYQT